MPLLKVEELTVDFGSFRALGGLSFSLDAGERLAIVGESRAGKSLCGLAIADLLPEGARRGGKLSFADMERLAVDYPPVKPEFTRAEDSTRQIDDDGEHAAFVVL